MILKNARNLLPYFVLIAIYFFFVNLEARKEKNDNRLIENQNKLTEKESILNDKQLRITIPVIPFSD